MILEKRILAVKENYLLKNILRNNKNFLQVLPNTLTKSLKTYLHILAFQNIPNVFLFFFKKQTVSFSGHGYCPPPFFSRHDRLQNVCFFLQLPLVHRPFHDSSPPPILFTPFPFNYI